ncbi:hypothetical protein GCM10010324_38680 [Streptomyces hiroshimensis]|uniref:Uncharacterized protein n=1 Tax=Streptomyces hiroshimensis TaxID=66424 RepID=A0ABQ2YQQ2_9ACTN|nr:hypothetical protein GCM10010324_38680 [Streptomyces hiroshimensis]
MHLDVPDTLQPDAGDRVVRSGVPPAAVPVPGKVHCVEPAYATKARISRLLPGLDTAEECGKSLIQTP